MKCDAYRILITGYIDEVLSENENRMLKQHLQTCESCLHHLQRQEALRTTLKRYAFLQEPPVVPLNFAQKVTAQLQPETVSVFQPERLTQRIRQGVLRFVEAWSINLKANPFAWTAAVSCAMMLVVGLLAFNMFYSPAAHQPVQLEAKASVESAVTPAVLSVQSEPLPNVISDAENPSVFEIGFVEEQSSVAPAQARTTASEGYVYSHVVGGYQDRLIDDIMFVGYAQDAVIQ